MTLFDKVQEVLVTIGNELESEWTVDSVSKLAGYSPYHFHRIFRGITGESIAACVGRLRLERAAFHLIASKKSIREIWTSTGYNSGEVFGRNFRRAYEKTPSAFREEYQNVWHLPGRFHLGPELETPKPPKAKKKFPVTIQTLSDLRVLGLRFNGPYLQATEIWPGLLEWAGKQGVVLGPASRLGICHDDPDLTGANYLRYDGCIIVDKELPKPDHLQEQRIPGGRYAVWDHHGPYEELEAIYRSLLGEWLPQTNEQVRDLPCLEIYEVTPFEGRESKDFVTKICLALA
jgi:AraC family transcriptional regulator